MTADDETPFGDRSSPPLEVPDEVYALGGAGIELALSLFGADWMVAATVGNGQSVDIHCIDTATGEVSGLRDRVHELDARGEEIASRVRERVDDPDAVGSLSVTFDSVVDRADVTTARELLGDTVATTDGDTDVDAADGAVPNEPSSTPAAADGDDWLTAALGSRLDPGYDLRTGTDRHRALGKALHYLALAESSAYRGVFHPADEHAGADGESTHRVAVVTSLGGGTGSALAVDIARRVREHVDSASVTLFATVPATGEPDVEKANAFAALSELEYATLADGEQSPFEDIVLVPMEPTDVAQTESNEGPSEVEGGPLDAASPRGELATALSYTVAGYYTRGTAGDGALEGTTAYAPFTTAVPQVIRYGGAAVTEATDAARRALGATARTVETHRAIDADLDWFLETVVVPEPGSTNGKRETTDADRSAGRDGSAPVVSHADDEAALRDRLSVVAAWLDSPVCDLLDDASTVDPDTESDSSAADPLASVRAPFTAAATEAGLDVESATGVSSGFGDPFGEDDDTDQPARVSAARVLESVPLGTLLDAVETHLDARDDPWDPADTPATGGAPDDSPVVQLSEALDDEGNGDTAPDLDLETVTKTLEAALRTVVTRRHLGRRARTTAAALDGPVADAIALLVRPTPDPDARARLADAVAEERAGAADQAATRAARVAEREARLADAAETAATEWRAAVDGEIETAAKLAVADLSGALDRVTDELESFAASLAAGPADDADSGSAFEALNALEGELDGAVPVDPDRDDIEQAMAGLREARRLWSAVADAESGLFGRLRRTGGKRAAYADVRADVESTGVFSVPPLPETVGDAGFAPVVTYSPSGDDRLLERAERARRDAIDDAIATLDDRLVTPASDGAGTDGDADREPTTPSSPDSDADADTTTAAPEAGAAGRGESEDDEGGADDPGTPGSGEGDRHREAAFDTPAEARAAVRAAIEELTPASGDGDLLATVQAALAAQGGGDLGNRRLDLRGARRALADAERRRERAAAAASLLADSEERVASLAADRPTIDDALATTDERLARVADVDDGRLDGSYVHATLPGGGRLAALEGDSLADSAPFDRDERERLGDLLARVTRERLLDRQYNGLRRNSLSAPFDGGSFTDTRVGVATLSRALDPTADGDTAGLFEPGDLDVGEPIRRHFSLDTGDGSETDGAGTGPSAPDRWYLQDGGAWDVGLCAYVQGLGFLDNLREVDGFDSHYRTAYERATADDPAATLLRHAYGLMRGFLVRRADVRNVDANPGAFIGRDPERLRQEQLARLERIQLSELG